MNKKPDNIERDGIIVRLKPPLTKAAPYCLYIKLHPQQVVPDKLKQVAAKLNEMAYYLEVERTTPSPSVSTTKSEPR